MNHQYMTAARPTGPAAFGYSTGPATSPPAQSDVHQNNYQQLPPNSIPQPHMQGQQMHQPPPNMSGPMQPQRGPPPFQGLPPPGVYQPPGVSPIQTGKQVPIQSPPNYNFSGGMGTMQQHPNVSNLDQQNGAGPTPPPHFQPPGSLSAPVSSVNQQPLNQPGFAGRPAVRPFVQQNVARPVDSGHPPIVNQMGNLSLVDHRHQQQQQQQRPLAPPHDSMQPPSQAMPQFQSQQMSSVPNTRSHQHPGPPPPQSSVQQQQQQQQRQINYGGPPSMGQQAHYPPSAGASHNMPPTGTYNANQNQISPPYESMNGQPGPPMHQTSYGVGPTPPHIGSNNYATGAYPGQPIPPAQRLPQQSVAPPPGQPPVGGPVNQPGFNQGYQRMPPGGQMQPPQQQQQQRRLDPDMMPSPIQVIEDDRKNREGVFSTNERGAVPPLVTTSFITEDQGNCNPRFIRSSMYSVPNSPDMMKQSQIPFTLTISPFAKLGENEVPPPIANRDEMGPVRCIRCKAYMCPYMQFIDGGRRFHCNFCRATTDVPAEYFAHLDHTGQRVDKYERPELCLGSYEFVATKDYCKNNTFPRPPAFIFIIDVSYNSVRSGVVRLLCENMKELLANLPKEENCEESQIEVGFITYSSSVHFYNLKSCLAQPQAMVVPDVQDMFVPLLDGFLVGLRESESLIDSLVEQIPKMYEDSRDTEIILGPAIKAGLEALKAADRAGKLFIFHSSLPIADAPGKLKNRDDRKLLGTDKEKTILAPQNTFYNQLGQDCVTAACSVDLFTFPNAYIDIATIGQVCRLTGGQIHKYTYFQVELDGPRFIEDLRRSIHNQVAFDGIMRIRTSAGIRPTDFYGNYFMSNTTDIELAAVDRYKAISVEIKHDDKLNEEDAVYIQAAILYTSVGGQRRLRIHNLSLNTCGQMADLYRNCELDALMNYFSKASLRKLCDQTPKQVRDDLISKCATSLACYRKNCANPSSAGQLILPECMKLLPLYANCLLKSDAIAGGSDMATDDRSFAMHALNSMDVASSLSYIYPRLIPVHDLDPKATHLPTALRCSIEKLKENGAYLLENGVYMFLWIGVNITSEWLVNVFGVESLTQIDIDKPSLLEFDNPTSQSLRRVIGQIREERPRSLKLMVIRQRDKLEVIFKHFLVEDTGMDNSPSYVDFLCHVHKEIRNLLS